MFAANNEIRMKYIILIALTTATLANAAVTAGAGSTRTFSATTGTATTAAQATPIVQQMTTPVSFAAPVAIRSPQLFAVRTSPQVFTTSAGQAAPAIYSSGAVGGQTAALAIRTIGGGQTGSSFVTLAPQGFQTAAIAQPQQPTTALFAAPATTPTISSPQAMGMPLTIQFTNGAQSGTISPFGQLSGNMAMQTIPSGPILAFSAAGQQSIQQQPILFAISPMAQQRQQLMVAPQMFTMGTGDCPDVGGFATGGFSPAITQGIQLQMPTTTALASNC